MSQCGLLPPISKTRTRYHMNRISKIAWDDLDVLKAFRKVHVNHHVSYDRMRLQPEFALTKSFAPLG